MARSSQHTVFRLASMVAVLALLLCVSAAGQVLKGSISGTVADSQGAVLSGAQVKATQADTGAVFTTTSDSSGLFRISLIPAGTYKIEITAQGFKTAIQSSVAVTAGADQGLGTIKLSVGGTSETLEIVANAPLIESTQAQVTSTFSGITLENFVGVQENQGLDNLALFVPGVASVRDQGFSNTNGGVGFSSNGIRGRNNDQEIDGQNNNDNSVAGPALFLGDPNFVQQYVVVSNNFGPEYGRNGGSVVNIITKSGGNNWHGSIYGTENNSVLNTLTSTQKDAAGLTAPPRSNDEFGGGTIGGPWVKNKFFSFFGFSQEILSTNNVFTTGQFTPTPAGLAQLAACPSADPNAIAALSKFGPFGFSGGNPTPSNVTTVNIKSGNTVVCPGIQVGNLTRTLSTPNHTFNWVTREDWQISSSDTLSGRYLFNRNDAFNANDNGVAGYVFNIPALSQAVLLSETHNFGAHMVNEARVGYDRLNVEFGGGGLGNEPATGQILNGIANIAFLNPNFLGFGDNAVLPQGRFVNTWQAQDNWNYVLGRHQLKAGINWTYQQSPNTFLPFANGGYLFNDLSGFVLNQPLLGFASVGSPELGLKEYDTFTYVGDDWKIRQNLTLNLGLTWSYFGQPLNLVHSLDMQRETGATPLWDPTLPLSVRTSPELPSYKNAYGPSFGFAYSPQWGGFLTGRGKTVLRGGYRLSYDPGFYNIYLNNTTGAPHTLTTAIPGPPSIPANITGPNVRTSLGPFIPVGQLDPRFLAETTVSPNFRPDQVQAWSLGIEREVTKRSVFEIRYVGNHATNLFQTVDANPFVGLPAAPGLAQFFPNLVPSGVTACTDPTAPGFGRVSCGQGIVGERANSGFSDYNALQTQFRTNQLFNQLTMQAGYTYSKTTDNASEIFGTFGGGTTIAIPQNPFDPKTGEHGLSGLDFPNVFTLNMVEQLPFFKEQHGFMGHLLGGWQLSGDYIWASGQTYTPLEVALANATEAGDFFDNGFQANFNGGAGSARPFLGNPSAPANTVGIFCGDVLGPAGCTAAGVNANQLISLNSLNGSGNVVSVSNQQVRFIANTGMSEALFGTPFGNVPRNYLRDAPSNIVNFSVSKRLKLGERASFTFRATMDNAFNHPNFATVNPFVENAGNPPTQFGNVFATPQLTGDSLPGSNLAASRRIYFGGIISF